MTQSLAGFPDIGGGQQQLLPLPDAETPAKGRPLLRSGTEQRPVDAVGNHVKRIVLQKRPANQARQPAGRSHQRQPGHTGKNGALVHPVLVGGVHHPAGGIPPALGAVMTPALPPGTALIIKKRAVSGEGPAVVQRPLHLHVRTTLDPLKQQFIVDVISVDIVKPEQIRIIRICPLKKLLRGPS